MYFYRAYNFDIIISYLFYKPLILWTYIFKLCGTMVQRLFVGVWCITYNNKLSPFLGRNKPPHAVMKVPQKY